MGLSLGGGFLANSYKLTTRIVANSPKVRFAEIVKDEIKQTPKVTKSNLTLGQKMHPHIRQDWITG
jgi:hypothetical protein